MGQPAARVGDMHVCPMFDGPKPHVGGPVLPPGVINVLIGGMPAATVGTMCTCASAPDVIVKGSLTVLIGGRPAARMGDMTAHGGTIVVGCPTVLIGEVGMNQINGAAGIGDFPIQVEIKPLEDILDWRELKWSILPDIHIGNIVIKPDKDDPLFQIKVVLDLIAISNTASGEKLLQSINNSGQTVTIIKFTGSPNNAFATPESWDAYRNVDGTRGAGCNVTVTYSPDISELSPAAPFYTAPPPIWLAHELVHADHFTHGTGSRGEDINDGKKDLFGNPVPEDIEELNTAGIPPYSGSGKTDGEDSGVTENDIRSEWPEQLLQRDYY